MNGYKVFNPNFICNGFQFAENSTFVHEGKVKLCKSGFHFCLEAVDCFSYYSFDPKNIVCEITAEEVSDETGDDSKRVCRILHVGRRLEWHEVGKLCNTGKNNTGIKNSGNSNSGNSNSGNYNSGSYNSGNSNSGFHNSGSWNSGTYNSGNYNSGSRNSGNYNSGHYNSGHYNSGNFNSGLFNIDEPKMRIFGKELDMTVSQFHERYIIPFYPILTEWKDGKLVRYEYKEACIRAWNVLSDSNKDYIKNLPNFDSEIFYEITGIKI